jgi:hypothetical protein
MAVRIFFGIKSNAANFQAFMVMYYILNALAGTGAYRPTYGTQGNIGMLRIESLCRLIFTELAP